MAMRVRKKDEVGRRIENEYMIYQSNLNKIVITCGESKFLLSGGV